MESGQCYHFDPKAGIRRYWILEGVDGGEGTGAHPVGLSGGSTASRPMSWMSALNATKILERDESPFLTFEEMR